MKHEQFWNIIEKGRKTKNCEELNDIVQKELEKLSLKELVSYHKLSSLTTLYQFSEK